MVTKFTSGPIPVSFVTPHYRSEGQGPGPFSHIYRQRRVMDFLMSGGANSDFVRNDDGRLFDHQRLDPDGPLLDTAGLGKAMEDWPKFAALGAIGPDLFFFLQDYANPAIPCDEIMLGLSL